MDHCQEHAKQKMTARTDLVGLVFVITNTNDWQIYKNQPLLAMSNHHQPWLAMIYIDWPRLAMIKYWPSIEQLWIMINHRCQVLQEWRCPVGTGAGSMGSPWSSETRFSAVHPSRPSSSKGPRWLWKRNYVGGTGGVCGHHTRTRAYSYMYIYAHVNRNKWINKHAHGFLNIYM